MIETINLIIWRVFFDLNIDLESSSIIQNNQQNDKKISNDIENLFVNLQNNKNWPSTAPFNVNRNKLNLDLRTINKNNGNKSQNEN